jgi:hypothetical protein
LGLQKQRSLQKSRKRKKRREHFPEDVLFVGLSSTFFHIAIDVTFGKVNNKMEGREI